MKIGILVVPFITCEEHLQSASTTLESLRRSFTDSEVTIHAVVNRCDKPEWEDSLRSLTDSLVLNDKNILSRAWNRGIRNLLESGCSYVLVSNLDIVIHPTCIDLLVSLAQSQPEAVMWSGYEVSSVEALMQDCEQKVLEDHTNFSCFLVNERLFDLVGEFDERFIPAYHEDADMKYRMSLAQVQNLGLFSARFFHTGQGTLKAILGEKDEELALQIRHAMNLSMERYKEKWGGLPREEKYLVPFDGKS
jgi:GT2 family glycosyltransferase